ncbi:MAG TPA: uracil-DNA glycosylase [Methylibium sp.]|nr:uracil-DNA glycosylase [Methylibium sp.]
MSWDERQRALLAAMGLRLWLPPQVQAHLDGVPSRPPSPPSGRAGGEAVASHLVREPVPVAAGSRPAPETRPRPVGVETMDWPALRDAVAGCTACGLCRGRRNTVFGVGHERAHWMIVGEAPGENEDRQGEPFVGSAGQLLDNMLRAVGLSRAANTADDPARQVFIANVLKCRPPVNRNPRPEEVAQCVPFLKRQVALVQPRLILAMGRFAVQALLETDVAIGRLRGQVHRYEGVPVVVTYHPAYLLRNPADKARSWDDLCFAREVAAR